MEIVEKPRIGVVGGGSWATAIAKMLTENNGHINWFMRNIESIKAFKVLKHNPRYLCGVDFDIDKISFSDDLDWVIMNSDVIVFAIPSAFLQNVVTPRLQVSLKDKIIVSAIKGMIPDENLLIGGVLPPEIRGTSRTDCNYFWTLPRGGNSLGTFVLSDILQ